MRAAAPGLQSWRGGFGKLRRACARPHASNQKRSRISFAQTCFHCPASLSSTMPSRRRRRVCSKQSSRDCLSRAPHLAGHGFSGRRCGHVRPCRRWRAGTTSSCRRRWSTQAASLTKSWMESFSTACSISSMLLMFRHPPRILCDFMVQRYAFFSPARPSREKAGTIGNIVSAFPDVDEPETKANDAWACATPPLCGSGRFHVNSVSGDEDAATGKDYDGLSIHRRSRPGGGSTQVTREGTGGACSGRGIGTLSPSFSGKERIYSTCPIKGS